MNARAQIIMLLSIICLCGLALGGFIIYNNSISNEQYCSGI